MGRMVNLKTCVSTNFAPAQLADKSAIPPRCFGWLLVFVSPLALSSIFIVSYEVFRYVAVLFIHTRANVRNAMLDSLHRQRGRRERVRAPVREYPPPPQEGQNG